MRALPIVDGVPIVALSANAMQTDIDRGLQAGFLRYITKPITIEEISVLLDEFLGEKSLCSP